MLKRILLVITPSPLFYKLTVLVSGKLSSAQIKAGYAALKDIETFIKANNFNAAFVEANNTYYTRSTDLSLRDDILIDFFLLVPHEFGRHTPPLIKTTQQLKHEIELLEALDDIEVAFSTLNTDTNNRLNPVDQQYQNLKCQLRPMDKNTDTYKLIEQYLQSTHATTHQQYKMQIEEIFEVEKEGEKESFNDLGNKMLLWYVQFSYEFFYCSVNLLGMDLG
jgi:poly [ADP-ribose] polymerase